MFPHSRRAALALTCLVITGTLGGIAPSSWAQQPAPAAKSRSDIDRLADILKILVGEEKVEQDSAADNGVVAQPGAELQVSDDADMASAADIVPAADVAGSSAPSSDDEEPFGELDENFRAMRIPTVPPPGEAVRTRCRVESSSCRMREYAESGRRCRCGQLQGRIVN